MAVEIMITAVCGLQNGIGRYEPAEFFKQFKAVINMTVRAFGKPNVILSITATCIFGYRINGESQ